MRITNRDIEIFRALNRYRYVRANFLHRYVGGSKQNVHRRLGILRNNNYLNCPPQQKQSWNARYSPRIYALTPKSVSCLMSAGVSILEWTGTKQFWHQLMIADILCSFETLAKMNGWTFKTHHDLGLQLSLPTSIQWKNQSVQTPIKPDALFALNDTYFILEADRNTENLLVHNLELNSYLRKLLCYRDVVFNKTAQAQWNIPTPFILTITTSKPHLENIKALFNTIAAENGQAEPKSYHLAFKAIPILGSFEKHPEPLLSLLDDRFDRVGHPPMVIRKEVEAGRTKTEGVDTAA